VQAALARIDVTPANGDLRGLTAWWRRTATEGGLCVLVVLAPLELERLGPRVPPPHDWLALVTTRS
jgi:hypothetical protein